MKKLLATMGFALGLTTGAAQAVAIVRGETNVAVTAGLGATRIRRRHA